MTSMSFALLQSSVNLINILREHFVPTFLCRYFAPKITKLKCNYRKLQKALSYKKCVRKMLMKSNPARVKAAHKHPTLPVNTTRIVLVTPHWFCFAPKLLLHSHQKGPKSVKK